MENGGRVVHAAVDALHAGIVRVGIAVEAEQPAARLAVGFQAVGHDVLHLEIHVPILEFERADHAVAAQVRVVAEHRRILRIGDRAIPRAVDLLRQISLDDEIVDVALGAHRRVKAGVVKRIREFRGHDGLTPAIRSSFNPCSDLLVSPSRRACQRGTVVFLSPRRVQLPRGMRSILKRSEVRAYHPAPCMRPMSFSPGVST